MLNKLSFNIFNELNESESKKYKIKKKVLIESNGVRTIEENKSVCEKCGKEHCECDKSLSENVSNGKKEKLTSLKMQLEKDENQLTEDINSNALTKEQLWKLRKEIVLGSIYTNDYENSFGINPKNVQSFFDSFIEDAQQDDEGNFNNRKVEEFDNPDELYDYYTGCEFPFGEMNESKKLTEENSEKLGGDPEDFISDVQIILDTLNQIDTSSFGTKLAQQMIEDWVETCERQIQKGKRLASGDEFYSESSLTEDSYEDEYGDSPIKTNDKYQLYKSMKGTDIDGVTYSSYLVRDNNGNGVRSFIAKNDIEAERKFNESSINEDSIEDAKNDSIKKGLYSESSTSLRERFKKFLDNNVKNKDYNFDAYIDDLTTQYGNTGTLEYELSKSESKSGKPELFNYSEEDLKELGYNLDEAEENTEIDWDKPRYGDDILDNMWTAVCSNDLNYVKNAFNKDMIKPNTRYQTGTGKHSLIMGALRNNNFEMVDLLKSFGEKIQKSELEEYKKIMSSREYEDDLTKSSIEEAEEMQVKNLQVIKEQGNVYMLQDENKKMIVGENYNAEEGMIENAEVYENKDEADKDYLNRCEILKGGEKLKSNKNSDELNEDSLIETSYEYMSNKSGIPVEDLSKVVPKLIKKDKNFRDYATDYQIRIIKKELEKLKSNKNSDELNEDSLIETSYEYMSNKSGIPVEDLSKVVPKLIKKDKNFRDYATDYQIRIIKKELEKLKSKNK